MPDGSTTTLEDVKAEYASLVGEWNASRPCHAATAVLCEWDPWNHLPIDRQRVHIMGHSHKHMCTNNRAYGVYFNLGTWCQGTPNFVEVRVEEGNEHEMVIDLCRWEDGDTVLTKRERFVA
jgi:hypothetical protein